MLSRRPSRFALLGLASVFLSNPALALECPATEYSKAPAIETDELAKQCDQAAGRRYSTDSRGDGVAYRDMDVTDALPACLGAIAQHPENPRIFYTAFGSAGMLSSPGCMR